MSFLPGVLGMPAVQGPLSPSVFGRRVNQWGVCEWWLRGIHPG
jgi:hypothetical protein